MKSEEEMVKHENKIQIELTGSKETFPIVTTNLTICINRDVYEAISLYAKSDTSKELGGIILGSYPSDDKETTKQSIIVKGHVIALHTEALKGSVTFTHQSWDYMHAERERLYPDLKIIGWFHTHPGFGIFLSSYDLFIHQNFFTLPWQIAYVVDPVNHTEGFFCWHDGNIVRSEFQILENTTVAQGKEIDVQPLIVAPSKSRKSTLFLLVIIALLAVIAGGAYYGKTITTRYELQIATLEQQMSDSLSDTKGNMEVFDIKYIIRPGDTMAGISLSFYGTSERAQQIATYNKIINPNNIQQGQIIYIPRP